MFDGLKWFEGLALFNLVALAVFAGVQKSWGMVAALIVAALFFLGQRKKENVPL